MVIGKPDHEYGRGANGKVLMKRHTTNIKPFHVHYTEQAGGSSASVTRTSS